MSAYDLNCPACKHRWQQPHDAGDPDLIGTVCPACGYEFIEIEEEDDLCDE